MFGRKLIPVWIGIILLSSMFLMGQGGECPWGFDVVDFPDPDLDDAIRGAIGKPAGDICTSDLVLLTEFSAIMSDVTDLSGLENWGWTDILILNDNQISDISPLAGLTGLESLRLYDNQISDILPLANNSGIDSGSTVDLQSNPLSSTACTVHNPALESRGVYVIHDCP